MESWEFSRLVELLEEQACLLREILRELKAQNPPETFDLPGKTATMTRA
jgi:hypothetical protein